MDLTCPKCQATMRQYERNGVTLDQCSECRGLFLDRGELEKLIDAENSFYDGDGQAESRPAPQAAPAAQPAATQPFPQYDQIPPQTAPYQQPYQQGYEQPYQQGQRRYGSPGSPDSPNHWGGRQDQYGRRRKKSFLSELFD